MRYRLLSESKFASLPGGVPTLIGWEVHDDAGKSIGAVRDALLDDAGEARFLDVQLADVVGARRVLLPIGFTRPRPGVAVVDVPGFARADLDVLLRALPEYEGSPADVTDEYERRLGAAWTRDLTDQNSLSAVRSTDPDVGGGTGSAPMRRAGDESSPR